MDKRQVLFNFFREQRLAIISTVTSETKPSSAAIEFGETENLELIFDTLDTSRKYRNIQENPYVSFVIGWDENITVQYEGKAQELNKEEQKIYLPQYWIKNPKHQKWQARKGIRYFKVTPLWIRYSDLSKKPWEIFEVSL